MKSGPRQESSSATLGRVFGHRRGSPRTVSGLYRIVESQEVVGLAPGVTDAAAGLEAARVAEGAEQARELLRELHTAGTHCDIPVDSSGDGHVLRGSGLGAGNLVVAAAAVVATFLGSGLGFRGGVGVYAGG